MDLKKLAITQEGVWFDNVPFVDGSATDLGFLVVGKNSDEFKRIERKFSKELVLDRKKAANEISDQQLEIMCACVKNWKNVEEDGVALVCNYDTRRRVFSNPHYYWLVSKLDSFIGEDTNFLSAEQSGKN